MKHPIQEIIDNRFRENKIVSFLLENGGYDMNALSRMDFPNEDRVQFAQLIGYSLGGFGTLSYVSDGDYYSADNKKNLEKILLDKVIKEESEIYFLTEELDNMTSEVENYRDLTKTQSSIIENKEYSLELLKEKIEILENKIEELEPDNF